MIKRYKKFFENKSELSERIQNLNTIRDIFLELEDEFGITIKSGYYEFIKGKNEEKCKDSHYNVYNEEGKITEKFFTMFNNPKGYFALSIMNPGYQDLKKEKRGFGPKFIECIHRCINRVKVIIDIELEIELDDIILMKIK